MEVKEVGKSVQMKLMEFLSDKPFWMYWIVYSALSGILFVVFYIPMFIIAQQWWIPFIVIMAVGLIWGSFAYTRETYESKEKKKK